MHRLYNLRDTLCEELEKVSKKESISTNDLDIIDKLAHSIKNLDKVIHEGSYGDRYSYDRYSYGRRGRDGDNDGRYNEGRSRDSYSRMMKDRFRRMMDDTSNDRERDAIMRCIEQLDM